SAGISRERASGGGYPAEQRAGPSGPARRARSENVSWQEAFSLPGKVAIVTGAGRGIGAATALPHADAGADLVLAARTKEQLDAVAEEIRGKGRRAHVIPCDVNENQAVDDIVAQTMAEFGRVDVVVNNAGGTMPRPLMDTSPGYLERSFHFNVT